MQILKHKKTKIQMLLKLLFIGKNQIYMLAMHYPESMTKTFVFQKQDTQQATFVDSEIALQSTLIDISALLLLHCPPSQFKVCIYDPQTNEFVSLQKIKAQNGLIPSYFLEPSIILIRFHKVEERLQEQSQQLSSKLYLKATRDIRSKQRTIRETLAIVKRWRQLSQTATKPGRSAKRMNLQQSAREIGISKKSLDDYYCQLRLAELHNFNFVQNLDQKIGKVRNFVKGKRVDQAARIRHYKHPKNLKVLQEFIVDKNMENYILHEKLLGEKEKISEEHQVAQLEQQNPFLNEFLQHKVFENLQDAYYKNFQFLLDEPSDPFLCDDRIFQKKRFEDESDLSPFF